MDAFLMWGIFGFVFVGLGIHAFWAKKPVHFWNIQEVIRVNDVRKYNRAMGILWIGAAIVFIAMGIPLLMEDMAWISILGGMWWAILLMVIYTRIEKKYRI